MSTNWNPNWESQLRRELSLLGVGSITELVESHSNATYEDLAKLLPGFAPVQIQRLHYEESGNINDPARGKFWKTSLIRYLMKHVPDGIRMHGDWPLILALGSWAGSMPETDQKFCSGIVRRFKRTAAAKADDWFPSEDDANFRELFDTKS